MNMSAENSTGMIWKPVDHDDLHFWFCVACSRFARINPSNRVRHLDRLPDYVRCFENALSK